MSTSSRRPKAITIAVFIILLIGVMLNLWCSSENTVRKTEVADKTSDSVQKPVPDSAPVKPEWPFTEKTAQADIKVSEALTAKNYLLVYDGSGSMLENKCAEGSQKFKVARAILKDWISSVPTDANIGLVAFHNKGWVTLPMGATREQLIDAVQNVTPGGNTPLGEAFNRGFHMLTDQALRQLGYGEYILVTITDGAATDMSKLNQEVRKIIDTTPIFIYTIGFCIGDRNHSLNQPGKTLYRSANEPAELRQGLKEVLAESETFDISAFN